MNVFIFYAFSQEMQFGVFRVAAIIFCAHFGVICICGFRLSISLSGFVSYHSMMGF